MLITAENRIYAITKKNRTIASCFSVITISQFIFGLYLVAYSAVRGGESVTICRLLFLPTPMFQRNRSHRSHFRFTYYAISWDGCTLISHLTPYLSHMVRKPLVLHPEGEAHSHRPPDFLAFSVIVYLVVRSNVDKIPIPSLLRTIARDATHYFLILFTSQFMLVMFVAFANVRISS